MVLRQQRPGGMHVCESYQGGLPKPPVQIIKDSLSQSGIP